MMPGSGPGVAPAVSNVAFLSGLLPTLETSETWWTCSYVDDPNSDGANWYGGPATPNSGHFGRASANSFFAIATIKRREDASRRKTFVSRVFAIPLDDVEGPLPLEPTWVIQTSPGKQQAGYRLAQPLTDLNLADRLIQELVRSGHIGKVDRGGCNVARYVRLPVGCNTKAAHVQANGGKPFPHRLIEWHPERAYSPEQLAAAFGLDLTVKPRPKVEARPGANLDHALLLGLIHTAGIYKRDLGDGRHEITCPWVDEHTDAVDSGTCYFAPSDDYPEGGFKCQHGHCADRSLGDLRRRLGPNVAWGIEEREPERHEEEVPAVTGEPAAASKSEREPGEDDDQDGPVGEEQNPDPSGVRGMLRKAAHRFTVDDLVSPPPRQRFVLYPYVPAGTVTTLAGPGGSSKTTLLTYLAVCRAQGSPFFGSLVSRGKTVILTTEDGREDYWRKLASIRHEMGEGFDAPAVADNVVLLDMAGIPLRLVQSDKGNWHPTQIPEHLAAVVKEIVPGADLVIMETVSRLVGGVETNESLSILVESAQRLCLLAGVAVILVAHVSQEAGRQGFADAYAPRGGSALGDNGRSTMVLTRINENNRKQFVPNARLSGDEMKRLLVLTHPKSNGAPGADPRILERVTTPFGPALRPAHVRGAEDDRAEIRGRVVAEIARLTSAGIMVTAGSMRGKAKTLGVARDDVEQLIEDALVAGELAQAKKPGRGGGTMVVPTGKLPAKLPDEVADRPSAASGNFGNLSLTAEKDTEKKLPAEVAGTLPATSTVCEVEEGE